MTKPGADPECLCTVTMHRDGQTQLVLLPLLGVGQWHSVCDPKPGMQNSHQFWSPIGGCMSQAAFIASQPCQPPKLRIWNVRAQLTCCSCCAAGTADCKLRVVELLQVSACNATGLTVLPTSPRLNAQVRSTYRSVAPLSCAAVHPLGLRSVAGMLQDH
jgi:hypothetical protein